jgi:hypothetical protein
MILPQGGYDETDSCAGSDSRLGVSSTQPIEQRTTPFAVTQRRSASRSQPKE